MSPRSLVRLLSVRVCALPPSLLPSFPPSLASLALSERTYSPSPSPRKPESSSPPRTATTSDSQSLPPPTAAQLCSHKERSTSARKKERQTEGGGRGRERAEERVGRSDGRTAHGPGPEEYEQSSAERGRRFFFSLASRSTASELARWLAGGQAGRRSEGASAKCGGRRGRRTRGRICSSARSRSLLFLVRDQWGVGLAHRARQWEASLLGRA